MLGFYKITVFLGQWYQKALRGDENWQDLMEYRETKSSRSHWRRVFC
jgi:hypothetical protein